jgi:hypothetical protein
MSEINTNNFARQALRKILQCQISQKSAILDVFHAYTDTAKETDVERRQWS